jgi:hypothetical protein
LDNLKYNDFINDVPYTVRNRDVNAPATRIVSPMSPNPTDALVLPRTLNMAPNTAPPTVQKAPTRHETEPMFSLPTYGTIANDVPHPKLERQKRLKLIIGPSYNEL